MSNTAIKVFQDFFSQYNLTQAHELIDNISDKTIQLLPGLIDAGWELTANEEKITGVYLNEENKVWFSEREMKEPQKVFINVFNYKLPEEWKAAIKNGQINGHTLLHQFIDAVYLISFYSIAVAG